MSTPYIPAPLSEQLRDLARDFGTAKMVLFGSRARGDHHPRSDIDLAVWGIDSTQAGRLRLALEELPTLLQFDLVIVSPDTSPELLRNIQLEGVTLYAADEM